MEPPAHATTDGYFVAAVNRVGTEEPWNIGNFYGSSYICNPRVEIIAKGSEDKDELVTADIDLGMIKQVRHVSQFCRERRPETYHKLLE